MFLKNGECVAVCDDTNEIWIYDAHSCALREKQRSVHAASSRGIAADHAGRLFATGSDDAALQVFGLTARQPHRQAVFYRHENRVWSVRFAPDDSCFVSTGSDGRVIFWPTPSDDRFFCDDGRVERHVDRSGVFRSLAFSSNARFLAAGVSPRTTVIDRVSHQKHELQTGEVSALKFLPDNRHLLVAAPEKRIVAWDLETDTKTREYRLDSRIDRFDLSANQTRCAVFDNETKSVHVYSWPPDKRLATLSFGDVATNSVQFHPTRSVLFVAADGVLAAYDAETCKQLWQIGKLGDVFVEIAFLPNDDTMIVAEGLYGLSVRSTLTGQSVARLSSHSGKIIGVAISPDGRNVASICDQFTLRIWDRKAGQPLLEFTDISGFGPGCLRFSPSGDELALGDSSGKAGVIRCVQAFRPSAAVRVISERANP